MNNWQIIRFVLVSLTVVVVLFGYLGWRLIGASRLKRSARQAAWIAFIVMAVLIIPRPFLGRAGGGMVVFALKQVAGFATGFMAFSFLLLLFRDVLWLLHGTPAGIKGIAAIRSDPAEALRGAPPADFKLLLAHQPSSADAAQQAGFDLMLAGHTHGGQFFPWNHVAGLAYRLVQGLGRIDQLQVYVSRGVGVYVVPIRLGIPPELTLLVLQPAGAR